MAVRLIHDAGAHVWICDLSDARGADLALVDALARLHLCFKRSGSSFRLRHANRDLARLIELLGLSDVLKEEI
ncbi:MAG: STAS domain-containing protein [Actinomycetota bacterium]|nr:STAS domain-containing protein [Actinomycetota bacterium]